MEFKNVLKVFDLLADPELLEFYLSRLTQEERDELYSHPLLKEYDLLP